MKKIFVLIITVIAMCAGTRALAATERQQASGNENLPTSLILNESFNSYLSGNHSTDYYTFTLESDKEILIICDNLQNDHEYELILSGNGMKPIYTTDNVNNGQMYLTAELNSGVYNIAVSEKSESDGDWNYCITVSDQINGSGYIINNSDFIMIDDDFEDDNTSNWLDGFRPHYEYGNKTINGDENNKYITFTPINNEQYYIFEAKDVYSTSVLCSEFDIQFSTDNMEIQIRQADSNLDNNFKMAGRIRKISSRLQYYSNGEWNYMFDNNGEWLAINAGQWYTLRLTLDVRTDRYSIYLEDRNTGNIISRAENAAFGEECAYISYYAFSSLSALNIDNVRIFESNIDVDIEGRTYIKAPLTGIRQYKYLNVKTTAERGWSADKWSILNDAPGITIDENTGIVSVSEDARPGTIIITAARKYYPWIKATYLVDIDR